MILASALLTIGIALVCDHLSEHRSHSLVSHADPWLGAAHSVAIVLAIGGTGPATPFYLVGAAVLVSYHLRALNELTHFTVHRLGSATRGERLMVVCLSTVLRGESIGRRYMTHVVEHHPRATEEDDPTARDLWRCAGRSRSRLGLIVRLSLDDGVAKLVRPFRSLSAGTDTTAAVAALAGRVAIGVAVVVMSGVAVLVFGVLVPVVFLYPLGMALSVLIEHNWADVATPAPPSSLGRHTERETARGFRLACSPLVSRVLSVTIFPYGDLYHYAHSCAPRHRWQELRRLDAHHRAEAGDHLLTIGLGVQLAGILERAHPRPMRVLTAPLASSPGRRAARCSPTTRLEDLACTTRSRLVGRSSPRSERTRRLDARSR